MKMPTPGALTGVKVLDISTLFPAPMAAAMLGDFGADVVKLEPPEGDPLRVTGIMAPEGRSYVWAMVDRNKRAIRVDFTRPEGLKLVQRLTAEADVVVLNQPVKLLERWGCTYEQISARNPGAIVVYFSGFGASGP